MSDRLSDLKRQRALLQEHLAWLDREIAQASNTQVAPSAPAEVEQAKAAPLPASGPLPTGTQTVPAVAADVPHESAGAMAADAKRGCLIAFAVGMVLFFALVLGAYFITRGGR